VKLVTADVEETLGPAAVDSFIGATTLAVDGFIGSLGLKLGNGAQLLDKSLDDLRWQTNTLYNVQTAVAFVKTG
jgi:hypothetical protein